MRKLKKEFEVFSRKIKKYEKNKNDNIEKSTKNVSVSIGLEMLIGTSIGIALGLWIDNIFNTTPIFFLLLFAVGTCAGFYNTIFNSNR